MGGKRICVAGLSERNGHVRPLPTDSQLARSQIPGTWALGRIVELGPTKSVSSAPRYEDREFKLASIAPVTTMSAAAFWERISKEAESLLSVIFGDAFQVNANGKGFVSPGQGDASLGLLRLDEKPTMYDDYKENPRLRFGDGAVSVDCAITDVRLRRADNVSLNASAVAELRALLRDSNEIILSVGLTYATVPENAPKHWLQVNNVHCSDQPLWRANQP
jgi:hypothetical protein